MRNKLPEIILLIVNIFGLCFFVPATIVYALVEKWSSSTLVCGSFVFFCAVCVIVAIKELER